MRILDEDEITSVRTDSTLGVIGGLAYGIAGLACLVVLYGVLESYLVLHADGSPDAMRLSNAVSMILFGRITSTFMLIIGIICQKIAFTKYDFSPLWMWRIMLICTILAILTGLITFHLINLTLSLVIIIDLIVKGHVYKDPNM
jgi:hypothetical protein